MSDRLGQVHRLDHVPMVRPLDVRLQVSLLYERVAAVGTVEGALARVLLDVDEQRVLLVERLIAEVTDERTLACNTGGEYYRHRRGVL